MKRRMISEAKPADRSVCARADLMRRIVNSDAVARKLDYLSARWADESEYEDFADYAPAFESVLPEEVVVDRMTRRPFGAVVRFGGPAAGDPVHIFMKLRGDMFSVAFRPAPARRSR